MGSSLLLTFVLAAPATINCASTPHGRESRREERRELDRIYDRNHADYHSWNDKEDGVYRQFLAARHKKYRVFFTLRREEQTEYWTWRHSHFDADHEHP